MFVREEEVTVLQKAPDVLNLDTGLYEEQEERETTISASVQPITGEDLKKLPEGIRIRDLKVIFTHTPLEQEYILLIKEKRYVYEHEDDWDSSSATIRHYRYIFQLESDI